MLKQKKETKEKSQDFLEALSPITPSCTLAVDMKVVKAVIIQAEDFR